MSYSKLVYLAGPVAGLSYEHSRNGWRADFSDLLPPFIQVISPMRGKDSLKDIKVLGKSTDNPTYPTDDPITSNSGILGQDFNDIQRCDAMVACFLGAGIVSIGTCVEFGWASALRKPIIIVIEPEGNVHDHIFLTHTAIYRVIDLIDAARIVAHLLGTGI